MKTPIFIDLSIVLLIQQEQIDTFGGSHGLRDQAMLESALGQAQQTWAYTEDIFETAAQYCYSLANNHPFVDGNKRIGAACMLVFLELNQIESACSVEELFSWSMEVATGSITRKVLAGRLRG